MNDKKSIIIYFSRADENYSVGFITKGNTEVIAEYIKEFTNAEMFKVERKEPYAKDYNTCIKEAQEEQRNNARPELAKELENIDDYEVVYIGSPVYWGDMPQPLFTQLEKLNWQGKTIYPFITHEGSGQANIPNQISEICQGAKVEKALAIRGSSVHSAKQKVEEWLY